MSYSTQKSLNNGYLVPLNYYSEVFEKSFTMLFHMHSFFEIMYCYKGSFTIEFTHDLNRSATFRAEVPENYFIFINKDFYHKLIINTDECHIMNIEFEPSNANIGESILHGSYFSLNARELFTINTAIREILEVNKPFLILSDKANVAADLKSLIEELAVNSDAYDSVLIKRILTVKLFIDISRCNREQFVIKSGIIYLKKALEFIKQNYQRKIKIDELAEYAGVTPTHLQRLFKKEFGETPVAIITRMRLEDAKRLLNNTQMTVQEIGTICGFHSRQHFTSEFQKYETCSPGEYRKIQAKKTTRLWTGLNNIEIPE